MTARPHLPHSCPFWGLFLVTNLMRTPLAARFRKPVQEKFQRWISNVVVAASTNAYARTKSFSHLIVPCVGTVRPIAQGILELRGHNWRNQSSNLIVQNLLPQQHLIKRFTANRNAFRFSLASHNIRSVTEICKTAQNYVGFTKQERTMSCQAQAHADLQWKDIHCSWQRSFVWAFFPNSHLCTD